MTDRLISNEYADFLADLKIKVSTSRYKAAKAANRELILLYHHIGTEILRRQKEYGWGAKVIDQLRRKIGKIIALFNTPIMPPFTPIPKFLATAKI